MPATSRNCWDISAHCSGSLAWRFCWCITREKRRRRYCRRPGLRGSGDIHAFGDSNLYLQRTKEHLILSSEHRAAPAAAPVYLELVAIDAETTHLEVMAAPDDNTEGSLEERVLDLLSQGRVLTRASLRDSLTVKNERLGTVLESLERAGKVGRTPSGWKRLS